MAITTRYKGLKRPDLTGVAPRRALSSSQPSTRRETAAAQSLLSISSSNNRVRRGNGRSQKQSSRDSSSRARDRTKSPNLETIAAAAVNELRPKDINTNSEINGEVNDKDKKED